MARIRTIKPEFFTSRSNADLRLTARLTFIGLWTYVDDAGRGADDARLVKAAVWPLDDKQTAAKVEADLAELEAAGKILRYEADGDRWLQVTAWAAHQRINRPSPSKAPPAPSQPAHGSLTEDAVSTHDRKGTGKGKEQGKEPSSSSGSDSTEDDDDRFHSEIGVLVSLKEADQPEPPRNLRAWRQTVWANSITEHGDQIRSLMAEHPAWPLGWAAAEVMEKPKEGLQQLIDECGPCGGTGWTDGDGVTSERCAECLPLRSLTRPAR